MPKQLPREPDQKTGMIFIGNSGYGPAQYRPALAVRAMEVIAEWSLLEGKVADLFVSMAGGASPEAAIVFSTIQGQAGQREAIRAISKFNIEEQRYRDLVEVALDIYSRSSRLRNKLAHWVWGFAQNMEDCLLLADPKKLMVDRAKIAHGPVGGFSLDGVEALHEPDFKEALDRITNGIATIAQIRFFVQARKDNFPAVLRKLEMLESQPEVSKVLRKLAKDRGGI